MKRQKRPLFMGISIVSLLVIGACSLFSTATQALPTPVESQPVTVTTSPTEAPNTAIPPSHTPEATQAFTETPALPETTTSPPASTTTCEEEVCTLSWSFPLSRPIGAGGRQTIDPSYRFGDNDHGKREVHHGVEFLNSTGTPVLAAAEGTVIVAGDDKKVPYGPFRNFYGNLVVLQHTLPDVSQPVYTLYGHLSQVEVSEGDTVHRGQKIGEVGSTGVATGAHLHFEVRLGENSYRATRNPELWLQPLPDDRGQPQGAIAGRILSASGNLIQIPNVVIEQLSAPGSPPISRTYINTYADRRLTGLEPWGESFAIGGLPEGDYKISFVRTIYRSTVVHVSPGGLTMVTFQLDR